MVPTVKGVASRGASPALLQIGSADLSSSSRFSDVDLWTKTLGLFPAQQREALLLVFVDPNPEYEAPVLRRVQRLPIRSSQVRFVHGMVTNSCTSQHTTMYNFSQQAVRDFGISGDVVRSWLGPTRRYPLDVLGGYSRTAALETRFRENFLAFSRAANRSQYVQEVRVPCLTPSSLLAKTGIQARNLVMSVIDAEQADVRIVGALLDLPEFRPRFLQFELTIWEDPGFAKMEEYWDTRALLEKLVSHGYDVGKTYGNGQGGSDADNVIAMPRQSLPPQFSACDRPGACGPEGSRWNYLGDLIRINVVPKVREVAGRGKLPTILQIGSNDLADGASFTDMDLFTRTLDMIPPELRAQLRLVFVDANVENAESVMRHASKLPIQASQALFLHGMVTDSCSSEFSSMYRFGYKATTDFGVPWVVIRSWLGPTRQYPTDTLNGWTQNVVPGLSASLAASWRALHAAPNVSAYITELQIPCLGINRLLQKADITVGRMAMVIIDAERNDKKIVNGFLDQPHWRPGYVQYEQGSWWEPENQRTVQRLHQRGYSVGKAYGNSLNHSDAPNCIAVLSPSARRLRDERPLL